MKKGFTVLELLIAMAVMVTTFSVLAIITYDLTSKSELVIKRLNALSKLNFVNLRIIQNVQKAGPQPSKFLTVSSSSIRYEVLVPFSYDGHLTEEMDVNDSKITIKEKPFSPNDFDISSSPSFDYSVTIPFSGVVEVNFNSMTSGQLSYDLKAKAPMGNVNYSTVISLINIK